MDIKELEKISKAYNEAYDPEEREVFISLAANLHYPTVLMSWNGVIIYKNRKASDIRGKWRVGASIKNYLGDELFRNVMTTRKGEYVVAEFEEDKIAVLRFYDHYFLMFMSEFETNGAHIYSLYRYISNIPEKNFFVNRKLVPKNTISEEKRLECESFRRKFKHFYKEIKIFSSGPHYPYSKKVLEKEHDIVDVLIHLAESINNKQVNFGCKFSLEKRYDFFVNCSSKDIGVVFGILVFLSLQCSSARKPVIRFNFEKKEKPYSCRVSLSLKSDMTQEDIERYFLSDELVDERSLYFQTVKNLAAKYFWGLGVEKKGDNIEFYLKIVNSRSKDLWFHDSASYAAVQATFAFEDFISLLFGEIPEE